MIVQLSSHLMPGLVVMDTQYSQTIGLANQSRVDDSAWCDELMSRGALCSHNALSMKTVLSVKAFPH